MRLLEIPFIGWGVAMVAYLVDVVRNDYLKGALAALTSNPPLSFAAVATVALVIGLLVLFATYGLLWLFKKLRLLYLARLLLDPGARFEGFWLIEMLQKRGYFAVAKIGAREQSGDVTYVYSGTAYKIMGQTCDEIATWKARVIEISSDSLRFFGEGTLLEPGEAIKVENFGSLERTPQDDRNTLTGHFFDMPVNRPVDAEHSNHSQMRLTKLTKEQNREYRSALRISREHGCEFVEKLARAQIPRLDSAAAP